MANLVVGCGYLGKRVARRWVSQGETVYATTRKKQRFKEFRSLGIMPIHADVTEPMSLNHLPDFQTVLFAVGLDRDKANAITQTYVQGLKNTLKAINGRVERFIYISSTGVYGQTDGEWVDEHSICNPQRPGGIACFQAENVLKVSELGSRGIILRLAGIYGPDRIPRLDQLKSTEPFPCETDGFLNLIHVDDAVEVIVKTQEIKPNQTFLVSDGNPVVRRDFYNFAARLLGKKIQFTLLPPESSKGQRSMSNKRCSNATMMLQLGIQLRYPDYRIGLESIITRNG